MSTRIIGRFIALASVGAIALTGMPATSAAADTTPPVLTSVSLSPGPIQPGGRVTYTVDATDDVAVARIYLELFEESSGRRVEIVSSGGNPLVGGAIVTNTWPNGGYRIRFVRLTDAAGNYSIYDMQGQVHTWPGQGSDDHSVDLLTPTFRVSGGADLSAPVLSSLALTNAAARAGEPTAVSFAVSDIDSTVQSVALSWTNEDSGEFVREGSVSTPGPTGTIMAPLPTAGRWHLHDVTVTDSQGNWATYQHSGVISRGSSSVQGHLPGEHDVDLGAINLGLAPGSQDVRVVARPGRLTLVRYGPPQDAQVHSGYRVTVQPAGIVRDVSAATMASGTYDITGLPNGVAQTVTFTARSTWGDSPVKTLTGRPVLSGNVTGVADVTGDRKPDVVAQAQFLGNPELPLLSYPGTGAGGLRAATVYLSAGQGGCEQVGPMDVNILGTGEPLCQKDDLVAMNRGGGGQVIGSRGWRAMSWVDGGFSLNADAYPDIVAMNPQGELLMYPMTSTGRALAPKRIGTGWGSMISVISAGDLTGDRRNDIAAVDASGRLWLYPGNGTGGVTARRQIGSGWQAMAALLPLRDLSGDGRTDLGGITPSGDLRLYRGTGTGGVHPGIAIGTGWQRFL